jgi:hypothetical protein
MHAISIVTGSPGWPGRSVGTRNAGRGASDKAKPAERETAEWAIPGLNQRDEREEGV